MAPNLAKRPIVHGRALQVAVVPGEAARLDHIERYTEAGAEPDQGAQIGWNIGFIEGETHGLFLLEGAAAMRHPATGAAGLDNMPIGCHKTTQCMGRKQGIRRSFVPCDGMFGAVPDSSIQGGGPVGGHRFQKAMIAAFGQFNEET